MASVEPLEDRALLAIVWGIDQSFDLLGADEAAARQLVERAIDDWNQVLLDFNYDGDNNPDTDNTFVVDIGIFPFLGDTRGVEFIEDDQINENGRPTGAGIWLDDDGANKGWFYDATPGDDAEFRDGILDPFRAVIDGQGTNDFYRTILHELGHAVGIASDEGLAIGQYFSPAGTDQVDDANVLSVFHNPDGTFGSQGFQATSTSRGGVHLYEGPVDPNFPNAPIHPGDLMLAGRAVQPPPTTRQLISDTDVKILIDAYAYDARLPSTVNTFHVTLSSSDGLLYVQGLGGVHDDEIVIRQSGNDFEVRVNETVERVPSSAVNGIVVEGGDGDDRLTVDFAGGGAPIPVDGIVFNGGDPSGGTGDTLTITGGEAATVVHTFDGVSDGRIEIDGRTIRYTGLEPILDDLVADQRRFVFGDSADEITIGDDAGPADGRSRISSAGTSETVLFAHPVQSLVIDAGGGADTITVQPVDAASDFPLVVDAGDGADTIALEGGSVHATVEASDDLVLDAGDRLIGNGVVTGNIDARDGAEIHVDGTLVAANLANDSLLTLTAGSELRVGDFDNAAGVVNAAPDSTLVATGVVAPGGLGTEKQLGNLTFSGPEASLNGPVDLLGTLRIADGARLALSGNLHAGRLIAETGTQLDTRSVELTIGGAVTLAPGSLTGSGTFRLTGGGDLSANNNTIHELIIHHDGITRATTPLSIGSGGLTLDAAEVALEADTRSTGPVVLASGSRLINPDTAGGQTFAFESSVTVQEDSLFEVGPGSQASFGPGFPLTVAPGGRVRFAGTETNPVVLRSLTPGSPWSIVAADAHNAEVLFADLQDADATGAAEALVAVRSVDSGNNDNWLFFDAATGINLEETGTLQIRDFVGQPNNLTVSTRGDVLVFEDLTDSIQTHVGTQVNPNRVEIPASLIPGGQIVIELHRGNDQLTVRPSAGDQIDLPILVDEKESADDDQLVVDVSVGRIAGVQYLAGDGANDSVRVLGNTDEGSSLEFTPDQIRFNGMPIDLARTEIALLSNVQDMIFQAPVADNEIRIARPVDEQIWLTGSADGLPFPRFTLDDIPLVRSLTIQGDAGADHVIIDETSGLDPIPGTGIVFHADGQPPDAEDVLEISGGEFTRVVYDYESAADGEVNLSGRVIRFTGVEPIINSGSSTDLLFDLTSLDDEAQLIDAGNGSLSLVSLNGTFQSTTFPAPSLEIRLFGDDGDDSIAVGDLSASGFAGELWLLGEAGDDRIEIAPSQGIDIVAQGGAGNNLLNGLTGGPLVLDGGSHVELKDFTVYDLRDGSPAVQLTDSGTEVRFDHLFFYGHDDTLVELTNGVAGASPPTLDVTNFIDNTFRLESGIDGVFFVDNQTSPATTVDLAFNTIELDVPINGSRTVGFASDGRTIVGVTTSIETHGTAANNGDGTITYTPDPDYAGPAQFRYQLSDGATSTVHIDVVPDNQPPANSVPGPQTVNEDGQLIFSNATASAIVVSDPDAGDDPIEVHLAIENGSLGVQRVGQMVVLNNHSGLVTLRGRIADINATLDGLTFTPERDFDDQATLTITTDDLGNNGAGGPLTDIDTIDISVVGFNDAPVHQVPPTQTIDEDSSLEFSSDRGNRISVADPDAKGSDVQMTLRVGNGVLSVASADGLTALTGDGSATVSIVGSVDAINAALNGLTYAPGRNFNGEDVVTVETNDRGNTGNGQPLSDTDTITIDVRPVNDAPVNSVPGPQAVDEEMALVFSTAGQNRISISDVDAANDDVEVTLSVNHGRLTLASAQGLTTVAGDGTNVVSLTGRVTAVNAALNQLNYASELNFNGTDTLTIRTNDLGHRGDGGPMFDSDLVAIVVNAMNDAPAILVPSPQVVREDTPLAFSNGNGNPLVVTDVDANLGDIEVSLHVDHGVLRLSTTDDLTQVTGNGTGALMLVAPLPAINAALEGVEYTADRDFNGDDSLEIAANDLGNSGLGGPLQDTDRVAIEVVAVNDGPIVTISSDPVTVLQDSGPQSLAGFAVATAGPRDEIDAGQTVTSLQITGNDLPALFSQPPTIDGAGTLTFTSAPGRFGTAIIQITATDDGGTDVGGTDTTVITFALEVRSDNNPPTVRAPIPDVTAEEDAPDGVIELGDNGDNFFQDADGELLTISAVSHDPDLVTATVVGNQLRLAYHENANGTTTVEVAATDAEVSTRTTFRVTLNPVNDAPQNRLPGPQTIQPNASLTFSALDGNRITIDDVDIGIAPLEAVLEVSQGTLTVRPVEGSNVSGDGTGHVTINGPLPGVNAALNGLIYSPPAGFTGPVTLTITSSDFGSAGAGGPLSDVDNLTILVTDTGDTDVTADIFAVVPNPRASTVDAITIQFSEAVSGFGLNDLSLTRTVDTAVEVLPGAATLTTLDDVTWTLGNLTELTADSGIYRLTLTAAGSGIVSLGGVPLTGDANRQWTHGAGDVNGDRQFDPIDLVGVLQSGKYLTGQPATWTDGDWNGDGAFNQLDIVVAQQTQPSHYLQGPFAAVAPAGELGGRGNADRMLAPRQSDHEVRSLAAIDALFCRMGCKRSDLVTGYDHDGEAGQADTERTVDEIWAQL